MAFQGFYVTDAGLALLSKAQSPGGSINFTRATVGDGQLGSGSITALTALIDPLYDLGVASVTTSGSTSTVELQFSNAQASAPFTWREIGLWAKGADGVEILYAYGNAADKADYIPSYGTSPTEFIFLMACTTGSATSVTAVADGSLVYAKKADLDNVIASLPAPYAGTPAADGTAAPGSSAQYARGDHVHPATPVFGASGATHGAGLVPDPGSTAGAKKYLREDGTWAAVSTGSGSGATMVPSTQLSASAIADAAADSGNAVSAASSTSASVQAFSFDISNPTLGQYSLMFRLKSSLISSTGTVVTIQTYYVHSGTETLLNTGSVAGTLFKAAGSYQVFGMVSNVTYSGKTAGDVLRIKLSVPAQANATTVAVDYLAYMLAGTGVYAIPTT